MRCFDFLPSASININLVQKVEKHPQWEFKLTTNENKFCIDNHNFKKYHSPYYKLKLNTLCLCTDYICFLFFMCVIDGHYCPIIHHRKGNWASARSWKKKKSISMAKQLQEQPQQNRQKWAWNLWRSILFPACEILLTLAFFKWQFDWRTMRWISFCMLTLLWKGMDQWRMSVGKMNNYKI